MKVITRQSLANEVIEHFGAQYREDTEIYPDGFDGSPRNTADIKKKLAEIGPIRNPDAVDEIIGTGSWTEVPVCGECGIETGCVVQIGEEPDYESSTAYVCPSCLAKALALAGVDP